MHWDTFKQDKYSTVGGDGGCRVGEVRDSGHHWTSSAAWGKAMAGGRDLNKQESAQLVVEEVSKTLLEEGIW